MILYPHSCLDVEVFGEEFPTLHTKLIVCNTTTDHEITTHMTRSIKKGPYVNERILGKVAGKKPADIKGAIKIWDRACMIHPDMVGFTFGVHNGKEHLEVFVSEDMVGHRFGEFSPTKKFWRHGGKMQKELDQKKRETEIAAAKAAKAS